MENGILKENKEWLYVLDENGNKVNDPNYDGDSWLGYAGLEKQFEERLRGIKGSFAYIQGKGGAVKQILYNVPAVDGEDLHLTVKINMQQRAEEVIKNIVYDDSISGTVIVMNPTTGGVEAMVSFPGYDPNSFSRGDLDDEAWSAMEKDPKTPLLNRAIQGLYPPGSTFKPLVAITALESGNVTLDWAFPEEQERLKGTDTIWNPTKGKLIPESGVTKVTRTWSTNRRGPMNMKNCMIQSDNIYFAYLGMKIGWDTLKKYLTVMGMGEAIPFELPTQKSQIKNTGTADEPASEETMDLLAMTGYGQGELLLTPLQLACYISAFRNGGTVYAPYVIESIWQEDKTEYREITHHEQTIWKELCATSTAESIRDMLEGVVEPPSNMGKNPVTKAPWAGYGTGRFLSVLRVYTCAGKTGTAELAKKQNAKDADKELAWFVAFRSRHLDGTELAPEEERLVLVMLEIDMTKQVDEWTQMKFLIAQALLKDDTLTVSPGSESCIEERSSEPDAVTTAAGGEGETGEGNHAG
ncbi:MAG: penicillin-binding protein 2 [Clostridia bacterium]|nr:penicillin-binding protein 2 [Clostridia bacterium]